MAASRSCSSRRTARHTTGGPPVDGQDDAARATLRVLGRTVGDHEPPSIVVRAEGDDPGDAHLAEGDEGVLLLTMARHPEDEQLTWAGRVRDREHGVPSTRSQRLLLKRDHSVSRRWASPITRGAPVSACDLFHAPSLLSPAANGVQSDDRSCLHERTHHTSAVWVGNPRFSGASQWSWPAMREKEKFTHVF